MSLASVVVCTADTPRQQWNREVDCTTFRVSLFLKRNNKPEPMSRTICTVPYRNYFSEKGKNLKKVMPSTSFGVRGKRCAWRENHKVEKIVDLSCQARLLLTSCPEHTQKCSYLSTCSLRRAKLVWPVWSVLVPIYRILEKAEMSYRVVKLCTKRAIYNYEKRIANLFSIFKYLDTLTAEIYNTEIFFKDYLFLIIKILSSQQSLVSKINKVPVAWLMLLNLSRTTPSGSGSGKGSAKRI